MYNRADFQICNILADCPDDFPVSIYDDSGKYTMEYYTGTAKEAKEKYGMWFAYDHDKMENGIDIYVIVAK